LWARTHDNDDGGVAQHGGHTPNNRLTEHSGQTSGMRKWVHFWQPRANFPRKNLKENNRCNAKFTKKFEKFIEICKSKRN